MEHEHEATQDVAIARLEERMDSTETWQDKQNGHLQRVESKVDRLFWGALAAAGSLVIGVVLLLVQLVVGLA